MLRSIYIISDLHLGGEPGFQICSPSGQQRLATFIRWVIAQRTPEREVHLVIAGDIVDFLAEREFAAFTASDSEACNKLGNVFNNFSDVWDALRDFASSGSQLILMLGNHDIEMALPGPHRLLRDRLGSGSVEFIYDNQAFVEGPVLIEHGNRYDMWNSVPHDQLREVRSALSRREAPPRLPDIPGSCLVVSVMNTLKHEYAFVDLLKPETAAALPLLAVLKPSVIWEIGKIVKLYRRSRQVRFNDTGMPLEPDMIAAQTSPNRESLETEKAWQEAQDLAGVQADYGAISAMDNSASYMPRAFVDLWLAARATERDVQIDRLYRALKTFAKAQSSFFDAGHEDETYLKPARELAERGFEVIVFGHTHTAKRVPLHSRAVYLNSGTWADVIRLPESLLTAEESYAKEELTVFADDMANNHLDSWRTQVATFVRIDLGDSLVKKADSYVFRDVENIWSISGGKEV